MNPRQNDILTHTLPDWYLSWCWDNTELQEWWRTQWDPSPGPPANGGGSNINLGDRFTLGRQRQAGLVIQKILTGTLEPRTYFCEYHIAGRIGGFFYVQHHRSMAEGFFLFIPTAEQLVTLRHPHMATRLLTSIQENE